jgi:hypothetical protein
MKKTSILIIASLSCLRLMSQNESTQDSLFRIIEPVPISEVTAQSAALSSLLMEKASMFFSSKDRSDIRSSFDDIVIRVNELSDNLQGKDINAIQYLTGLRLSRKT